MNNGYRFLWRNEIIVISVGGVLGGVCVRRAEVAWRSYVDEPEASFASLLL